VSSSEIIIVRSLADSDMGLFSAHRKATTSKQRAIALTTRAVKELLHPDVLRSEGAEFDCISVFGLSTNREPRLIKKVGKNWRLGGRQIEGRDFADLDAKDFALIRSRRHNDGSAPILITFIGRRSHRWIQAGLAATLERLFHQSVAIFGEDAPDFQTLADLFPSVPARVAVRPPLQASLLPLN
jgi:hypothetical protein